MRYIRKLFAIVVLFPLYDLKVWFAYIISFLLGTKATKLRELSDIDTLERVSKGSSFIRLGDGEAMIMTGRDVYFQKTNRSLAKKFSNIVKNYDSESKYILGIPTNKLPLAEEALTSSERRVWRLYRVLFPVRFPLLADYSPLTFFYVGGRFKEQIEPLLKNRHVICVSNANVLDTAFRTYAKQAFGRASFVETPPSEALEAETSILTSIDKYLKVSDGLTPVILFAAGPASKTWAYKYANQGVQCLDIGHGLGLVASDQDRSQYI